MVIVVLMVLAVVGTFIFIKCRAAFTFGRHDVEQARARWKATSGEHWLPRLIGSLRALTRPTGTE
jgi:hypothetical protein